ncbi:carbohydrate ABC transporter membrane protein 1, CUT1 family (TC 3.A.1.1.-) [Cohnella sp. OV330]|uniref:ABC transporter permease n=1 Tax=Cohnella sp. OV330 TaxID=1855288 RepID=UPI0008E47DB7|nr:ABC transporter permease subunit [Cohnella sp. OV330]SFB50607.1 carbohydrate ABC transporter membrane protein 1, CUT1 family (TC 3.A.1.1.-) [Cohnella sp. OV330]
MERTLAIGTNAVATIERKGRMRKLAGILKKRRHYYLLLTVPMLYFAVFCYGPIVGNVLAFRKYVPGGSIYGEEWVGLRYFKLFLGDASFWRAFNNTWTLNVYHLIFTVPCAIAFALLVNEIKASKLRSAVQAISYFPNFISAVVVVGLMKELLSPTYGMVSQAFQRLGMPATFFMNEPEWFRTLYISSEIWQFTGWNSIIFFAAIASIDKQLYEAAAMDGAGRLRQMFSITIPQIMPTVVVVYILSLGHLMSVAFEKVLLMYTPSNSQTADVVETFVYRIGIVGSNYSYATAVGFFGGVLGLIVVAGANYLSRKFTRYSLY